MKIGIISDTHGLLRPEVFTHFADVDHILHAGDVGSIDLLIELESVAPVTAVWGNADGWDVRHRLSEVARITLDGRQVVVVHGQQFGSPGPEKIVAAYPDADLVVFGHSHRPIIRRVGHTLAVNPGSAGRRRFKLPVTVAFAETGGGEIRAELRDLVD